MISFGVEYEYEYEYMLRYHLIFPESTTARLGAVTGQRWGDLARRTSTGTAPSPCTYSMRLEPNGTLDQLFPLTYLGSHLC